MLPFSPYPSPFQYSQNYSQTQQFWQHFYAYQQQQYLNNYIFQNGFNANNNLNYPLKPKDTPIKVENQEFSQQTLNDKLHFEPVEIPIRTNLTKSPIKTQTLVKNSPQIKKKKTKKSNQKKTFNTGHWTKKEHRLYLSFIEMHKDVMMSSDLKKTQKIFKQMSQFIKTRSPCQCRSHHQKFDSLETITQSNIILSDMNEKF